MSQDEKNLDEIIEKSELEPMLEFETQIFLDTIHNDGLVIAAKGLSLNLVIYNLLKVYCDPGNLVVVLNTTETEEKFFVDKLKENVHRVTCSTTVDEREDIYLSGGIHFVTTRILVVDMLKKRIPIEKITGFIVFRAHKLSESCQEAFVLRLFRIHNKTGFVKGFSNSVESFTMGFCHVERIMRTLFVKELYIWPRFHSLVIKSLKEHEPKVIELHVPISANMKKMQSYILELMNLTVKELKRLNKTVELQEITVENCLTRKFHKILQAQLDAIWHQLSNKSRQLVADLKTLRQLIISMLYSDPIAFYSLLSQYRTMEYAQNSTWVLLQPAELLFSAANSLVFSGNKGSGELNPECCPKWQALVEILKVEIPHEIQGSQRRDCKILILCSDNRTCHQLNELLTTGPNQYLFSQVLKRKIQFKSINKDFKKTGNLPNVTEVQPSKAKKLKIDSSKPETAEKEEDLEEDYRNSYILTMSQQMNDETIEKNDSLNESQVMFEPFSQMENLNITQICENATAPTVLIQTFKSIETYVSLQETLKDLQPNYVIMYHSNLTAVRELEMYEAHRRHSARLKVFFIIHGETVEEQSYLTALRREKEAFEFLIETKSTMVVPTDQDGKSDQCGALQRSSSQDVPENTRQGGNAEETVKRQFVIVDMREFRSELPALIHKRGIDIEPVTITVGDYILTPEICVERKSISDLIGSLNSGRLYQQCTQMSRYYSKPMLLIEFDQNKPFSWQNQYMVSSDGDNFDIQQKLLLLTMHFPKLKLIWSPSPYATAQLFEELKQGKDEPNLEYANGIGNEEDLDVVEAKYNSNVFDFVQKLPGIHSKNIDRFMRSAPSLNEIVNKSETELKEILGNSSDAKLLYSSLHENHVPKDEASTSKQSKPKSRFKYCKK